MLYICLEQEERERRRLWMLAGGDPKKYRPAFPLPGDAEAGIHSSGKPLTGEEVARVILTQFVGEMKAGFVKTSLSTMAEWRPDKVKKVYKLEDGSFVDEQGNPVDATGKVFVTEGAAQEGAAALPQGLEALLGQVRMKGEHT